MLVRIREGVVYGDLAFQARPEFIAAYFVETAAGVVAVDPGPSSCREGFLESLRRFGATPRDLQHVLLTHIHLDHAGAVGSLVSELPHLTVHVHVRGARHLVDPTRLLTSARRIYGDDMDRLWGEVLPVPEANVRTLVGGERLTTGSRRWRVAATPGHAIHHVAYLEEGEGLAFTGDVAGEASQHGTPVLPATPPPDIDIGAWRISLDLLASWRAEALCLTHFGPTFQPAEHLDALWHRLMNWSAVVRESLDTPGTDDERAAEFAEAEWLRLTSGLPPDAAQWVHRESMSGGWHGLARYWRTLGAVRPDAGTP